MNPDPLLTATAVRPGLFQPHLHGKGTGLLLAVLLALPGCGEEPAPEGPGDGTPPAEVSVPSEERGPQEAGSDGLVSERGVVFFSTEADTSVVVPWLFRSEEGPEGVQRDRRVWLGRAGVWELLHGDTLQTPRTRTPWIIVPGGPIRLQVGGEDVLESLSFRAGGRDLEVSPQEFLGEWDVAEGSTFRLHRGSASFPAGDREGYVVDFLRLWNGAASPPGDWVFLHAGDVAQLFLEERTPLAAPRNPGHFRGWSRVAFQTQNWPEVELSWEEVRSFEPSRRDIPGGWSFTSPGAEIQGELEVLSSFLSPGPGEGPILPVAGFFEVEGELRVMGESFPVRGLIRHLQW